MKKMRLSRVHQAGFLMLCAGLFLMIAHHYGSEAPNAPSGVSTSPLRLPKVTLTDVAGTQHDLLSLSSCRFLLILASGDASETVPLVRVAMDCLPDDSSLSIVLICQSRPAQETLNELRFERVTVLTDPAGKLAQSLDVVAFPRLLFVGEGLEVVGARGEVAGELAAGFAAVLAKFAEGTRLEKSDLNLLLTGQQLPMLLDEKKGQEASEIMAASRGPWLVLHFSSTCSGCKVELGELKTTTDSGRHVRVLGVTSSPQEDIDQLLGEVGIVIPVIYDVSGEIRIKHDVSALPTAFVVDEEGSIISKMVGYTEYGFANLVDLCSSE